MRPLGVLTHEEIGLKVLVFRPGPKAFQMRLALGMKLRLLGPNAAIGALKC
jgi:hypothetical protein